MKKDDVVERTIVLSSGASVLHNVSSPENAKRFMEIEFLPQFGVIPPYEIKLNEETSQMDLIILCDVERKEQAKVNWVIDNEAALQFKDGTCLIINIEEKEWIVIQESVPSYQSSVADMSDEQLRASIEALRSQRATLPTKTKTRVPKEVVSSDPMAQALANMSPEKKLELMKKMGMID
jgi:hypothetical protein